MATDIIVPILVALIMYVPGLWLMNSIRKQNNAKTEQTEANASDIITKSALLIVGEYKAQVDTLTFDVNEAKQTIQLSANKIYLLEVQVKTLEKGDVSNQQEIERLKREVELLKTRIQEYLTGITTLVKQLKDADIKPDFEPKSVEG